MTIQHNHHQSVKLKELLKLAIWEWDIRSNHVIISEDMYHMFGVNKFEIQKKGHFIDFIHKDDKEFYNQVMDGAIEEKKGFFIEYRIIYPNDEVRIIQEKVDVVLSDQAEVVGMLGVLIDVTELKRPTSSFNLEYPITIAERKVSYGHWEWDIINEKLYLSREASLIFGLDPNETHTRPEDILINLVHQSDSKRLKKAIKSAFAVGHINIEYLTNTTHNNTSIVHVTGEMIKNDQQEPIRMLGTIRNISQLKQKEQVKLKTEKLSIVSQLAAGVAHEILNPLTSIRGFIKLMKNSELLIQENYFSIMEEEIERVDFIVNELLMLAKPQVFQLSKHHIKDILDSATLFIKDEFSLSGNKLNVNLQPDLPKLNCEISQIRQMFINLLSNANDSMDQPGRIDIIIKMLTANKMVILIEDEGCGIPENLLSKAGEPFYTTKEKGTGLGLMVCHRIVENHAGTIEMKRKKDKGTLVKIVIPITY